MFTEAAVLFEINKPLEIVQLAIPKLKRGQVLVEVSYSGACGTQLGEVTGKRGEDRFLPHCLGHEGVGTVLELGQDVKKVSIGDKVVLSWIKGSGIDAGGTVYSSKSLNINSGPVIRSPIGSSEIRISFLDGGGNFHARDTKIYVVYFKCVSIFFYVFHCFFY